MGDVFVCGVWMGCGGELVGECFEKGFGGQFVKVVGGQWVVVGEQFVVVVDLVGDVFVEDFYFEFLQVFVYQLGQGIGYVVDFQVGVGVQSVGEYVDFVVFEWVVFWFFVDCWCQQVGWIVVKGNDVVVFGEEGIEQLFYFLVVWNVCQYVVVVGNEYCGVW